MSLLRKAPLCATIGLICLLPASPAADASGEAQRAFQADDLGRAVSLAKQFLASDANSEIAHTIIGLAAARRGQWATAIESSRR